MHHPAFTVDGWAQVYERPSRSQKFCWGTTTSRLIASVTRIWWAVIPAHVKFSICVVGVLPLKSETMYTFSSTVEIPLTHTPYNPYF